MATRQKKARAGSGEGRKKRSDGLATLKDVARTARVSTATVSRVMNDQPGAGDAVRQRVLAVMRDLDYAPRAAARHLSSKRADTIGVVFQDLTAGWFMSIYLGIFNRLRGHYHVLTSLSSREGDEFDLPRRVLAERRVDGLLWLDMRATPRMMRDLNRQGVPLVVLQQSIDDPLVSTVSIDSRSGAYQATKHLLDLGRRRMLVVSGLPENPDSQRKLDGVRSAFAERGMELRADQMLVGHHMGYHAVRAIEAHLQLHKMPDAILAFNDDMAIALLLWLRGRGVRVPEDVSVVGYDGIPEAAFLGLTTVETPLVDMGVMAAQLLVENLERPQVDRPARQVILQGTLRIRESCGARPHVAVEPGV
jgi:DNA-binding LacI/PurR family transcriptional regulator